jgi:hypothetical protein
MKNCRNSSVPVDDLVGRVDAHLDRQHQRDEDHPERRLAEGEAEIDHREGGQDRDHDLADRDAHRHHEGVDHHGADRLARGARRADQDGAAVVVERLVAGGQGHVAVDDGGGVVGRGDDRHINGEGDDQHANREHHIGREVPVAAVLDHQYWTLRST